ncbi:hypothetical protein PV735_05245 [Streptomyces turgidiscabies]|uniref:Uncharacterized protein n=1 Tax=Streptomyces turgidiscabies (strain Car8) TaxID=698760 RepID=L7EZ38_STRT8|nr:hypothetical protein [Streptomyces turgidiscabies]ELP64139.1 hypothetical protein STRTUCAR8_05597 [Streptomyces turgidiscabies Car8]MDX3492094.1 hypothetical protein [Streptomyces turgidiscabies]
MPVRTETRNGVFRGSNPKYSLRGFRLEKRPLGERKVRVQEAGSTACPSAVRPRLWVMTFPSCAY